MNEYILYFMLMQKPDISDWYSLMLMEMLWKKKEELNRSNWKDQRKNWKKSEKKTVALPEKLQKKAAFF